jgi:hypothetical protein
MDANPDEGVEMDVKIVERDDGYGYDILIDGSIVGGAPILDEAKRLVPFLVEAAIIAAAKI